MKKFEAKVYLSCKFFAILRFIILCFYENYKVKISLLGYLMSYVFKND